LDWRDKVEEKVSVEKFRPRFAVGGLMEMVDADGSVVE